MDSGRQLLTWQPEPIGRKVERVAAVDPDHYFCVTGLRLDEIELLWPLCDGSD
jgi:hypothetical protein